MRTTVVAVVVATYLCLGLASAKIWEHQHDEGFSFDIAVARPSALADAADGAGVDPLAPQLEWPHEPVLVTDLYDYFGGRHVHDFGAVRKGLADSSNLNPPAYYVLLHLWVRLTGTSGLGLRGLGLLIGVLALLGLRRLAALLVPRAWAPELAMALMALAPWFHAVMTFLRPYGLGLCVMLWGTVAVLEWHRQRVAGRRGLLWPGVFVTVSLLGLWSLYHHAFVVAWHGLLLGALSLALPRGRRLRSLGACAVAGVVILVGIAPLLATLAGHLDAMDAREHWSELRRMPPEPFALLGVMLSSFTLAEARWGAAGAVFSHVLSILALVTYPCVVLGFVRGLGRSGRVAGDDAAGERAPSESSPLAARIAWWTAPALPLAVMAGDVLRGTGNLFVAKYCYFLLPLLVLLVTMAVLAQRPWWGRSLAAVWIVLLGAATLDIVIERKHEWSRLETVAAHVAGRDRGDHWVVVSSLSPGFLVPFVATLRDAGVGSVRVVYAPTPRLGELVGVAREQGAAQMTLVNYDTRGTRGGAGKGQEWFTRTPQAFKNDVRRGGWKLITVKLAGVAERSANPGKPLTLFMRVEPKFFHGLN